MAKKKPAEFNELEWFAEQSEAIRDLLWGHLTSDDGWTWKDAAVELQLATFLYRHKSLSITVGQSEITIIISALGEGYPARSVRVAIKESGRSFRTFEHVCKPGYDNRLVNIRRIVELTMLFITPKFVGDDRGRFYPPKPPKPNPEAEFNKDLWIWDEE